MEPAQIDGPAKTQRRLVVLRRERLGENVTWEKQAASVCALCEKHKAVRTRNWWERVKRIITIEVYVGIGRLAAVVLECYQITFTEGRREGRGKGRRGRGAREARALLDHVLVTPFVNLTEQEEAVTHIPQSRGVTPLLAIRTAT